MSENQYKQKTKFFQFPVPGYDDGIWPAVELKKWQMVENLILAAQRGNVNAIFREGDLRIKQERDGSYSAILTATGNEPSAQGAVGGAFFESKSTIVWSGLQVGNAYYLYIKGSNKTFYDAQAVVPVASITRLITPYVTLVAKADLTSETLSIDRNPPGKVNARDLGQHVVDYDNPHGDKMIQDELLIRNHLALGNGNDVDLEFDVNGEVTHIPLSQVLASVQTSRMYLDFVSAGKEGITLTANGRISFANVVRTNPKDAEAGEVSIGFYEADANVMLPNQVIVYNSGNPGVSMRAMIVCN